MRNLKPAQGVLEALEKAIKDVEPQSYEVDKMNA